MLLSLVVDPDDGTVLSETYYVVDESGTFGEITTDPSGLFFPVVLHGDTGEWVPTSDVGLFADLPALQYEFVPIGIGDRPDCRVDGVRLRRKQRHPHDAGPRALTSICKPERSRTVTSSAATPAAEPATRHTVTT